MTLIIGVAIFGLIIGSFLNVCIWRLPRRMSVISPSRSQCPKCKTTLSSLDNIPVLSWLLLRGRCRYCQEPISSRYPFVEILSAIAALMSYIYYGGINPTSIVVYMVSATLIVITFTDIDFQIIPDVISIPGIIIGYIIAVIADYTSIFEVPVMYSSPLYRSVVTDGVIDSIIGSFSGAGFFIAILYVHFKITKIQGLGLGDVKLIALLGAVFGWKCIMPTIFVGSFLGAIFGILMMTIQKTGRETHFAFGPWLALGALIYLFTDLPILRF